MIVVLFKIIVVIYFLQDKGNEYQKRKVIYGKKYLWPNGIVPYVFASDKLSK